MASKNFSGILRDPLGTLASNDKYRFTHVSTTGEVIRGSTSYLNIGDDGVYNIDIEYGNVTIESYNELGKRWINQGTTTINADTTVTTLPALLNALVPASDPLLIQLEALLADAEQAASEATSRSIASTTDMQAATNDAKISTPLKVKQAIDFHAYNKSAADAEFVSRSDIVGTVAQSGGMPTGAIIESGSNSNGKYIKYADGTLICTGEISADQFVSDSGLFAEVQGLAVYRSKNPSRLFPLNFTQISSLTIGTHSIVGAIYPSPIWSKVTDPTIYSFQTQLYGLAGWLDGELDIEGLVKVSWQAIGRWY